MATPKKPNEGFTTLELEAIGDPSYTLRRLKRGRPDLAEEVLNGEISASNSLGLKALYASDPASTFTISRRLVASADLRWRGVRAVNRQPPRSFAQRTAKPSRTPARYPRPRISIQPRYKRAFSHLGSEAATTTQCGLRTIAVSWYAACCIRVSENACSRQLGE